MSGYDASSVGQVRPVEVGWGNDNYRANPTTNTASTYPIQVGSFSTGGILFTLQATSDLSGVQMQNYYQNTLLPSATYALPSFSGTGPFQFAGLKGTTLLGLPLPSSTAFNVMFVSNNNLAGGVCIFGYVLSPYNFYGGYELPLIGGVNLEIMSLDCIIDPVNNNVYLSIVQEQGYVSTVQVSQDPTLPQFLFTPLLPPTIPIITGLPIASKWCATPTTHPQLMIITGGVSSYLFSLGFSDDTYTILNPSLDVLWATFVSSSNLNFYQVMDSNTNLGELYVMQSLTNNVIATYNVATGLQTSVQTISPDPNFTYTSIYVPDGIQNTYSWVAVNNTTAIPTWSSLAVSKTEIDHSYLINFADNLVYKATFDGDTLSNAVPVHSITGTFASINSSIPSVASYASTVHMYSIRTQTPEGTYTPTTVSKYITSISRNNVSSPPQFTLSYNNTTFVALDLTCSQVFASTGLTSPFCVWTKNAEDVDSGPVDIYSVQVFIDLLNDAFERAYSQIPTPRFTDTPFMSLDYTSGLLTLSYSADYTTPITNGILFNTALLRLCRFPSTVDTVNPDYNRLGLKVGSTSQIQNDRSIFQFNLLDKIVNLKI